MSDLPPNAEPQANPYRTPLAEAVEPKPSQTPSTISDQPKLIQLAKETFFEWEKLRVIYLLACGLTTIAAVWLTRLDLGEIENLISLIFGAVVANACYFAGPIADTYCRWLGLESGSVRYFLFIAGTLFTCAAAVFSVYELARM